MDMEELISIILPIYRVERYLPRAVDSCLAQTYTNLEIILVDDGSDDGCGALCDAYAKKDSRIRVIHKENGGLSDARNAGLDAAKGAYIAFVDSDDYIAPDFISSLFSCIREQDADVALCSYVTTQDDGMKLSVFEPGKERDGKTEHIADGQIEVCGSKELKTNLYDAKHRDATYFIVAWNKLYHAQLWKDVRFPKGKIHEDEAVMHEIYDRAKKGVYLHRKLYAYYQMPQSITRAAFSAKRLDWFDALDARISYFEQKGERDQVSLAKEARANAAIHYYYRMRDARIEDPEWEKRLRGYVREGRRESTRKAGYTFFLLSPFFYRTLTCVERDDKERLYQLFYSLILVFTAFLCLYKLGVKYVDPWDEARHGVNAVEMLKSHNLIKSTYLYETDYYNLKPMLSMWLIMAFMKIFGMNVLGLRLPSVCCYLLLSVITGNFVRNRYGRVPALFSMMFLAANTTPFLAHMVRSGDADSLFVLLFSIAMFAMISLKERPDRLWIPGLSVSLAFLTKSFHAGIIAVIGIVFLLFSGLIRKIRARDWLRFFSAALLPVGLWGLLRYQTDGTLFFRRMWETDVLRRTAEGFGSNEAGPGYYFSYYLGSMSGSLQVYLVALVLLIAGCVLILSKNGGLKALKNSDVLAFALWILVPAVAFSAVRTKLLWYVYPAVTALLIAAAVVLGRVVNDAKQNRYLREGIWFAGMLTALFYSVRLLLIFHNYGIDGNQVNAFQQTIALTAKIPETHGRIVYRALTEADGETVSNWAQQDVFVAEAYGDYFCRNGGFEEILPELENETEGFDVILFTDRTYYEEVLSPALDALGYLPEVYTTMGEYMSMRITTTD